MRLAKIASTTTVRPGAMGVRDGHPSGTASGVETRTPSAPRPARSPVPDHSSAGRSDRRTRWPPAGDRAGRAPTTPQRPDLHKQGDPRRPRRPSFCGPVRRAMDSVSGGTRHHPEDWPWTQRRWSMLQRERLSRIRSWRRFRLRDGRDRRRLQRRSKLWSAFLINFRNGDKACAAQRGLAADGRLVVKPF
jgi:hypothetical protein